MSLKTIFDAVKALSVSHDGSTVLAYNIDALPNSLPSADLPIRLLDGGDLEDLGWLALGDVTTSRAILRWVVIDTFYLKPVTQGETTGDAAGDLVTYASAYLTQLQSIKKPTTTSEILEAKGKIGVEEYPIGSGAFYYVYKFELKIQEQI